VLELFFFDQDIHFSDHSPDLQWTIRQLLRTTRLKEGLLSPVTRSIFLHPPNDREDPKEMELYLRKRLPVSFSMIVTMLGSTADRSTIDPVYTQFQQAILPSEETFSLMLIVGHVGDWFFKQMIHLAGQTDFYIREQYLNLIDCWQFESGSTYPDKSIICSMLRFGCHEVDSLGRGKHIFFGN
jgi:hypothetical protein